MESINWYCFIKLCDNDEKMHCDTTIELNDQMTIIDLKKKLKVQFPIEIGNQQIFRDGKRIDFQPDLKLANNGEFKELTLKHSLLPNWDAFVQIKALVEKSKNEKLIEDMVKSAMLQLQHLEEKKFFECYPLNIVRFGFYRDFAHYSDTDAKYLQCAVRAHFQHLFPTAEISFEQKTKGVSIGTICLVKEGENLLGKYYIKSHYNLHKSSGEHHAEVDLRELFIYKLLANIHVGPPVYFIRNTHYSKYVLFIATKAVNGFMEENNPNFKRKPEFDWKLELLKHIFELGDLHSKNYGADENGNLMIVDFMIDSHIQGLKSHLNKNKSKFLNYSKILKSWNLEEAVIIVDEEIKEEKKISINKGITNKNTHDYNVYVERIKQNIKNAISKTDQQSNHSEELSPKKNEITKS